MVTTYYHYGQDMWIYPIYHSLRELVPLAQVTRSVVRQLMEESGADHGIWGIKWYDQNGRLRVIHLYNEGILVPEEKYRALCDYYKMVHGVPVAVHNRKKENRI